MKKIRIIDLLNKIANGEEVPKKIIYRNNLFEYIRSLNDYQPDDIKKYHGNYLLHYLFEEEVNFLNDEVEILDEKKIPEKIKKDDFEDINEEEPKLWIAIRKINEIIDYLKSKGE